MPIRKKNDSWWSCHLCPAGEKHLRDAETAQARSILHIMRQHPGVFPKVRDTRKVR